MFWGGLGWVLGGPIGAIIGYSLAGMNPQSNASNNFLNLELIPKHNQVISWFHYWFFLEQL